MHTIISIAKPVEYCLVEKRSQFYAFVTPALSREDALRALAAQKIAHPEARHHCMAYLIGSSSAPTAVAYDDAGEPAGTAGKPMLHLLTQRGIGNCCAIVVRYFGGIKLGAGGLARAYSQAVSLALNSAELHTQLALSRLEVTVDFDGEASARRLLNQAAFRVTAEHYTLRATLVCEGPTDNMPALTQALQNDSKGRAHLLALT